MLGPTQLVVAVWVTKPARPKRQCWRLLPSSLLVLSRALPPLQAGTLRKPAGERGEACVERCVSVHE